MRRVCSLEPLNVWNEGIVVDGGVAGKTRDDELRGRTMDVDAGLYLLVVTYALMWASNN